MRTTTVPILGAFAILAFLMLPGAAPLDAASEAIYGLDQVKLERVYDPNSRPERLMLVSGNLKLVGGLRRGNVWQAVIYIPQRTAAPRTDHGVFRAVGDQVLFYSFLTFGTYRGTILEGGERLQIVKISKDGRSQTETWYLDRGDGPTGGVGWP